MVDLEDRILERALAGERTRTSAAEVRERYGIPEVARPARGDRGAEPQQPRLLASDVRIIEAISRFRAGGYEEAIGFTVYDTLRYKRAMEDLVREEVEVLIERVAGEMDPDRAMK